MDNALAKLEFLLLFSTEKIHREQFIRFMTTTELSAIFTAEGIREFVLKEEAHNNMVLLLTNKVMYRFHEAGQSA
jgi:hypothetical protein